MANGRPEPEWMLHQYYAVLVTSVANDPGSAGHVNIRVFRWRKDTRQRTPARETLTPMKAPVAPGPNTDPAMTRFVTASNEENQLAQELRRQIEQRYPVLPDLSNPYWSVGAD